MDPGFIFACGSGPAAPHAESLIRPPGRLRLDNYKRELEFKPTANYQRSHSLPSMQALRRMLLLS
jgi:hypothetical protein